MHSGGNSTNQFWQRNYKQLNTDTVMRHILLNRIVLGFGLAGGLAFTSGCATNTSTGDRMQPMKGGEHQMMLNTIKTTQDLDALGTGDDIAMVCAKCKTLWITRVKQGVKGAQLLMENGPRTELVGTHACAGCSSILTVVGVQKGAHTELKHSCGACGDDSAFCCATKPGSGPSQGMEGR